ncbi:replication initiation protein [Acinetobacter baumannii]|nr:replication initiation protein [Acinetobacter baumannii]
MQQLSLALEQFTNNIPNKPYCSDDLNYGVRILPKQIALLKRYIQPNHPYYTHFFVFDLDYSTAYIDYFYSMIGVPTPNLIVENPENGHAHYVYQLKTPIYNTDASKPKPIQYGNAVYNALRDVLNADVGYVGLIAKNPLNKQWRAYTLRDKPYSLNELASKLEIDWKEANKPIKQDEAIGLGRNCCVFHTVRKWAYVEIRKFRGKTYNQWLDAVVAECSKVNNQFTLPMQYNEVKGISKSIARWVWKRDPHCYAMFIERQTIKGRKGGKVKGEAYSFKREQAVKLKEQGMNNTQIAKQLSVTRRTIINWLGV